MNHKLRIIFNSNAPYSSSGYGQQMAELVPRISKEGYPLATINYFGLAGGKIETTQFPGVIQYPIINHVYGSDALWLHGNDFKADVCFALQDIWVLNPEDLQRVNRFIPVVPVDHEPVPKVVLDRLRYAYRIVTYSHFGYNELLRNGFHSTYIPHTVDTNVFKPMDKKERKKLNNLPEDCFLVGMVAANKENPPRKSFQEVIDAFYLLLQKEPKALLYIHSNPKFPNGFDFQEYMNFKGIGDKLLFPDPYTANFNTGKKEMALIYNTFDVFVMPSISEGFGVGFIEAQACGVPVIGNRFTSMTELVKEGETGFSCEASGYKWDFAQSYTSTPSVSSLFDCFMKVHEANRVEMGKNARKFMVAEYDSDTVFEKYWKPFLSQLEKEVYSKAPVAEEKK